MPRAFRWPALCLFAWALAAVAAPAAAQTESGAQPERPSDGLFQRGGASPGSHTERLVLTLGVLTSHDDQGPGNLLGVERALAGASGEVTSALSYSKPWRKALFGAAASGGWRHHQELTNLFATTYTAGAGVTAPVSRYATLGVRGSYVASPYYAFNLLPSAESLDPAPVETPQRAHAVTTRRYQSYDVGATWSRSIGQHGRASVRADARRSSIEDDPARLLDALAGADYSHQVGASTSVRVGYSLRYGETRSPVDRRFTRVHDSDVGLTYRWQRTRTRRTTFSLSAGPSIVVEEARERVGWQAMARVAHMIGRSWSLNGTYRRGVRFVVGFDEPFFADSGTVTIEGLIGARWGVTLSGGLATGEVGIYDVDGHGVNTRSASGALQYAVSRHVAVFGSYVFYAYRFGSGVVLPDRELPDLSRSGLRIGLSVWVPLFSRADHGPR